MTFTKLEVHNVWLVVRTIVANGDMFRKFGKVWTNGFGHIWADRQSDTLITMPFPHKAEYL